MAVVSCVFSLNFIPVGGLFDFITSHLGIESGHGTEGLLLIVLLLGMFILYFLLWCLIFAALGRSKSKKEARIHGPE
jgi:hypothetical protein